jgi:hypothetical protein
MDHKRSFSLQLVSCLKRNVEETIISERTDNDAELRQMINGWTEATHLYGNTFFEINLHDTKGVKVPLLIVEYNKLDDDLAEFELVDEGYGNSSKNEVKVFEGDKNLKPYFPSQPLVSRCLMGCNDVTISISQSPPAALERLQTDPGYKDLHKAEFKIPGRQDINIAIYSVSSMSSVIKQTIKSRLAKEVNSVTDPLNGMRYLQATDLHLLLQLNDKDSVTRPLDRSLYTNSTVSTASLLSIASSLHSPQFQQSLKEKLAVTSTSPSSRVLEEIDRQLKLDGSNTREDINRQLERVGELLEEGVGLEDLTGSFVVGGGAVVRQVVVRGMRSGGDRLPF